MLCMLPVLKTTCPAELGGKQPIALCCGDSCKYNVFISAQTLRCVSIAQIDHEHHLANIARLFIAAVFRRRVAVSMQLFTDALLVSC